MNTRIIRGMAVLVAVLAVGSAFGQEAVKVDDKGRVTLTSKGKDVRDVLYDLFFQKKKNFVLESNQKYELYLNLSDISFDEALEIVLKQASLKYEIQNDIYYLNKRPAAPAGLGDGSTTKNPTLTPIETGATTRLEPVEPTTPTAGRVSDADMRKRLTTRFAAVDIRELFADFTRQTGVKIEVAADVPAYKVKAFLIDTSLKFALDTVTKKAKLQYTRSETNSLLVTRMP